MHCLRALHAYSAVSEIYIASNSRNRADIKKIVRENKFVKVQKIQLGGRTRAHSVQKLLRGLRFKRNEKIIIHNAANPFISEAELVGAIAAVRGEISGAAVGRPITSTLKKIEEDGSIAATIDREKLWEVETPQVVNGLCLQAAYKKLGSRAADATDDVGVLEQAGFKTKITLASPRNRKLTHARDADFFSSSFTAIGQDSHPFDTEGTCTLAGVKFRGVPKLAADSDGDVVFHAIANALSSAISGGSFGPVATAMRKRGIRDSRKYVEEFVQRLNAAGLQFIFCSISIQAVWPRLESHIPKIKKKCANVLKIPSSSIGITVYSGNGITEGDIAGVCCTAIITVQSPFV